jgi:hypothetical protein
MAARGACLASTCTIGMSMKRLPAGTSHIRGYDIHCTFHRIATRASLRCLRITAHAISVSLATPAQRRLYQRTRLQGRFSGRQNNWHRARTGRFRQTILEHGVHHVHPAVRCRIDPQPRHPLQPIREIRISLGACQGVGRRSPGYRALCCCGGVCRCCCWGVWG